MYLNYRQQCSLDWHTALLAAFAFDMDNHGSVVCGANISDVGLAQLVCAQARRTVRSEQARDLFQPNIFGQKVMIARIGIQQCFNRKPCRATGSEIEVTSGPQRADRWCGVVEVGGRKLCHEGLFVSIAVGVGRGQDRSHPFNVQ
jgi:hypothetical protein